MHSVEHRLAADTSEAALLALIGRMNDDPEPMRCIVVRHPRSDTTHTLRVMVGTGGTVRTCDPAVTDRDDPRTCIPT